METIVAKVVLATVRVNEQGFTNVELKFNKKFAGFEKDQKTKEFVAKDVDHFNVGAAELLELALTNEVACDYLNYLTNEERYTQQVIGNIYAGVTLTFERELHVKGEVVNDKALDRDKYFTTITKATFGDRVEARLERAIDKKI